MKIAWFNDYSIEQYVGGATITNQIMINEGRKRGHEIIVFTHDQDIKFEHELDKFNIIILNNINMFKEGVISFIIHNKKYVNYVHDYGFCQYRNLRCDSCNENCSPSPFFIKLFANSKLNIFLSPLHLENHKKFFGMTLRDAIFIPSPLEKGMFHPNKTKKNEYLFVGVLMNHKGINQVLDYADSQKIKLNIAGKKINKEVAERIDKYHNYLGEFKYEEMPKIYGNYSYMLTNPQWDEPFGRVYSEALASGCNIIKFQKSHKTGIESYNLPNEDMLDLCYSAPELFWDEVEKC